MISPEPILAIIAFYWLVVAIVTVAALALLARAAYWLVGLYLGLRD